MLQLIKNEKGFSLIEVLVALGLLGIIAAVFLTAINTNSQAVLIADERTTAESLARSQMEYVKEQAYDDISNPPQYSVLAVVPDNYSVAVDAQRLNPKGDDPNNDDGLQQITVTVSHFGEVVITLEDYKVDR